MNAKHRLLAISTKTNKKKRAGFQFIRSNQIFYLTFLLSIIFHVGVLYSIPAVDLFSENSNADDENLIVLDLLDDEVVPLGNELALSEEQEHQFQAAVPDIPWNWSEEVRESEPEADIEPDDVEFAPLPKITELKDEYTLVSEAFEQKPEVQDVFVKKRIPDELLTRPFKLKQPEIEKPAAEQLRPTPLEQFQTSPEKQVSPPELLQEKTLAPREKPVHDILAFPRRPQETKELQKPRLAEQKLTRPALDTRHVQERNLQDPPKLAMARRDPSDRHLGLVRENTQDKNRFGIFAGEKFEDPRFQNAQPVPEQKREEPETPDDVTQTAENLQSENEIEGPVKGRAIISRPRPPQIDSINVEVELRLKFWVLPDGTIGEIIPIKRGNAQLEQIAIDYLKRWRFEALPSNVAQETRWGTIPIKFTAQ